MKPIDVFVKNCKEQSVVDEVFSFFSSNPAAAKKNEYGSLTFYSNDIEVCIIVDPMLEDDFGIEFSKYSIQIKLIKLRKGEDCLNYDNLVLVVGNYLAEKLAKKLNCQTIMTENLSKILAEYQ